MSIEDIQHAQKKVEILFENTPKLQQEICPYNIRKIYNVDKNELVWTDLKTILEYINTYVAIS